MSPLVSMLRRRLMTVWLWQTLFVLSVLGGYGAVQLTIWQEHQALRFAAMDGRDTFYLASLGTFETAQHIHAELAKMAAETIYSRNPEGFDAPERLERLFNPATTAQLNKEAALDAETYRLQQIHSKFESGQVREMEVDDNNAMLSVEGQVLRTGMFNQRPVTDAKKVIVYLRLTVNGDIAHNGRYPLVVTDYKAKFE